MGGPNDAGQVQGVEVMKLECQNCDWEGDLDDADEALPPISWHETLGPGDIIPHAWCPTCGAACFPEDSPMEEAMKMVRRVARMTKDGEDVEDVEPFDMTGDDAVDTLHGLITEARIIVKSMEKPKQRRDTGIHDMHSNRLYEGDHITWRYGPGERREFDAKVVFVDHVLKGDLDGDKRLVGFAIQFSDGGISDIPIVDFEIVGK